MLALLMSGWRYRGKPTTAAHASASAPSRASAAAPRRSAGRRSIAYWLGSHRPPAIIRASIILYFAISTAIAIVSYSFGGVMTLTVLKLALVVAPVYALGLFHRLAAVRRGGRSIFRRICYALIAIAVVVSLPVLDGVIR